MSEIQTSTVAGSASKPPITSGRLVTSASVPQGSSAMPPKSKSAPAAVETVDPRELQKKLEEAVRRLNEQMQDSRRQLGFSVDNRLNRQIVRVTNQETGELVRQIPSEVAIRVANSIEDLKGILFDKEF